MRDLRGSHTRFLIAFNLIGTCPSGVNVMAGGRGGQGRRGEGWRAVRGRDPSPSSPPSLPPRLLALLYLHQAFLNPPAGLCSARVGWLIAVVGIKV